MTRGPKIARTTNRTIIESRKFARLESTPAAGSSCTGRRTFFTIAPFPTIDEAPRPERVREERPRQEADEQEDRVVLLAGAGVRAQAEQHAEEQVEHRELQERDREVPAEAEGGALVARAKVTPREVLEQLAARDQLADIGDHDASESMLPSPCPTRIGVLERIMKS